MSNAALKRPPARLRLIAEDEHGGSTTAPAVDIDTNAASGFNEVAETRGVQVIRTAKDWWPAEGVVKWFWEPSPQHFLIEDFYPGGRIEFETVSANPEWTVTFVAGELSTANVIEEDRLTGILTSPK